MFPSYIQLDATDCGPTCLQIISSYYGKKISLSTIRKICGYNRDGLSLATLKRTAQQLGFDSQCYRCRVSQLHEHKILPCILYWNQNHYVVLYKIKQKKGQNIYYISDPSSGITKYVEKDFIKNWLSVDNNNISDNKGILMVLKPTESFFYLPKSNNRSTTTENIYLVLKPYKQYFASILLSLLIASILSLLFPFFTQSIVDQGIAHNNIPFIELFIIAQLAIVVGQLANDLVQNWLTLHLTTRASIALVSHFLAKLMRLPLSFFDSKMTGDIMQRIKDYNRIQDYLTHSLIGMVVAIITFIIYGCVIGNYNIKILAIYFVGTLIFLCWVLFFLKRRRSLDYMQFREASANHNSIVQIVQGMQDIKLNNCEEEQRWGWEKIQARLFEISVKNLNLLQYQENGAKCIEQIKNLLITYISARAVINGEMTIGSMMAIQFIIGQLSAPVAQFVEFAQEFQDANLSFERINEIYEREDEEAGKEPIHVIPESDIVFKNVCFSYELGSEEKTLSNINVVIPVHKTTAIVGASGSGKSTMLKLMLGFYSPTSGQVFLGEHEIQDYCSSNYRQQCGIVMQDGFIFSDTIAKNIAMSNNFDMNKIRNAANVASISSFIETLPMKYETKIGADGHGLSKGQKQRILIARAIYKDASFLFFDEATNSLDANNENKIISSLEHYFVGKTVVVIAHRLSTVKNADNIIVLNTGKVVEQGSHRQLIQNKGTYYELVKNQLDLYEE